MSFPLRLATCFSQKQILGGPTFPFSMIPLGVGICCCSVDKSCLTLCNPMDCSTSGRSVLHYLLEFVQLLSIELVMPSNHLVLCHPLLLLPSIFPSIRVFSNESCLGIRWSKYWNFSFSISLSNDYSGLISFMIDCFDLLGVQGTLKTLLQHHSSKTPILRLSTFLWSNCHIHT